jgi:hypothetical protein
MKRQLTISGLLVLLLGSLVSAQHNTGHGPEPTDLTVLKKTWEKSFVIPGRDPNPLRQNEDLIQQTRTEKRVIENRDTALPNQPTETAIPAPAPRYPAGRPVDIYIYKLTVTNTGVKNIRTIDWEYQFLHPDTKEVLGSQRIVSKVRVAPGKTKTLKGQSVKSPARLVSADQLDKKYRNQYEERVIIHRIYYTDGPAWKRQP